MTHEPYAPDWDEIGAVMKAAIKKSRGYATWWEYAPVPRLGEHHAASVLTRFLFGDDAVDALVFPNQDPPYALIQHPLPPERPCQRLDRRVVDPRPRRPWRSVWRRK